MDLSALPFSSPTLPICVNVRYSFLLPVQTSVEEYPRDRTILYFIASDDFRSHFLCAFLILFQGLFLLPSVLPKQEKWRPLMSFMYSVRPDDVDDDEHKH